MTGPVPSSPPSPPSPNPRWLSCALFYHLPCLHIQHHAGTAVSQAARCMSRGCMHTLILRLPTQAHLALHQHQVHYNGVCYKLRVKPGPEGFASFQQQLHRITGLPELQCMQVSAHARVRLRACIGMHVGRSGACMQVCACVSCERMRAHQSKISACRYAPAWHRRFPVDSCYACMRIWLFWARQYQSSFSACRRCMQAVGKEMFEGHHHPAHVACSQIPGSNCLSHNPT